MQNLVRIEGPRSKLAATGLVSERQVFRADIQGLRAIAVLIVVAYHLNVAGFAGGYVGVDVFFVISGFLITKQIMRSLDGGEFSARSFYGRRVKRLLPASALVFVCSIAATWFFLSPLRVRASATESVWVALFSSNVFFAIQETSYLRATSVESIFQHYWSLAVEEQFYLVWPWLLIVVRAVAKRTRSSRTVFASGLALIMALSFACAIWMMSFSQPMAFFLLPARAWEMAVGGLLAAAGAISMTRRVATGCAGFGVLLISVATFLYSDETRFPGWTALLPVVATGLVIVSGGNSTGPVKRLLECSLAQFFGRISYSLYLWHWPLVVLVAAKNLPLQSIETVVGIFGLSVLLAYLSERWVERPSKASHRPPITWFALMTLGSLAVALGAAALSTRVHLGPPAADVPVGGIPAELAAPLTQVVPNNLDPDLFLLAETTIVFHSLTCQSEAGEVEAVPCQLGEANGAPVVALVGDSHAASWLPSFSAAAKRGDLTVFNYAKAGCPLYDVRITASGATNSECDAWRSDVYIALNTLQPDVIVLSGYLDTPELIDEWRQGMVAVRMRLDSAARVVVLGQTPNLAEHTPTCLGDHLTSAEACGTAIDVAAPQEVRRGEEAAAAAIGAIYVDPTEWLCADGFCPAIVGSTLLYVDDHHLSIPAAKLLGPQLAEVVGPTP